MPRRLIPLDSVYHWTKDEKELFLSALASGVGVYDYEGISAYMRGLKSAREVGVYRRWWARHNEELFIALRNETRRGRYAVLLKEQREAFLRSDEVLEVYEPFGPGLERLFALPELDYYSDIAV